MVGGVRLFIVNCDASAGGVGVGGRALDVRAIDASGEESVVLR